MAGGAVNVTGPAWSQPVPTLKEPQTLAEARSQLLDTIAAGGDEMEVRANNYRPNSPSPHRISPSLLLRSIPMKRS